jgi:AraC-like DNA-binding protein
MSIQYLAEAAVAFNEARRADAGEALPNLLILREDRATAFDAVVYEPVICLILQGAKVVTIGDRVTSLAAGDALIVSHDLPVQSRITEATPDKPYLALILSLDLGILRGLYERVAGHVRETPDARSLSSGPAARDLIDALTRYLALGEAPLDAAVLGPAILRELHYRLLMSPMGGMLRSLLSVDSHASSVSRAILKLRAEYRQTLAVADLAREAGMSPSSFHTHFKLVTKASCSACTASSMYLRSISTEILISDVVMTLMLMPSRASASNIFAATPAWLRIPMPTTETLATSVSATRSWKLISPRPWPPSSPSRPGRPGPTGQEKVMSVRPSSEMFCTIMSTFTPASASGPKIAAAMPGRSATEISVILASSRE